MISLATPNLNGMRFPGKLPDARRHRHWLVWFTMMWIGTLCHGADTAGTYLTYITPKLVGYTLNSGTTIRAAESGDGYTAIGNYSLNGATMDFITKLHLNGSLAWSYQVNDPTGGAILRHTKDDRVIVSTYNVTTNLTEISQFLPTETDEDPTSEYTLTGPGNWRFSSALRYVDASVYYLANLDDKVQLAKHGETGALEMAMEYQVQLQDTPGSEIPVSLPRSDELRDSFLLTFQSPGDTEDKGSVHFAKVNSHDGSIEWATHYQAPKDAVAAFVSTPVKVKNHMVFLNTAGLDTANQFRAASLNLKDGSLNAVVFTGANRNPPGAVYTDGSQVVVIGSIDQEDSPGRYFTATSFGSTLLDFTAFEWRVQDNWVHSFSGGGFSYPGRFNAEFQTQFTGGGSPQHWLAAFDLGSPEEGQIWVNDFFSFTQIGGLGFNSGLQPFSQHRNTTEQRLELGFLNECLGIGTARFETPAFYIGIRALLSTNEIVLIEPLGDFETIAEDILDTFVSPFSVQANASYDLSSFEVDVTHSNVGAEPEITVDSVEYSETATNRTLNTTVAIPEPTTVLISQMRELDGRTRLVNQQTVLTNIPTLNYLFKFRADRDSGYGLFHFIKPNLVEE